MVSTLYRDAALTDARSDRLEIGVSVLVTDDRVAWIRPSEDEDPVVGGAEVVDAGGATIVPGMVDAHSHLTGPGGAHWIERFSDNPGRLLAVAEDNAKLLRGAGVRWARDVGSPLGRDPVDGRERALSLGVRDRWAGRREYPYVRAAGTWITLRGAFPAFSSAEAADGDELVAAATGQLDDGADLVKLYLDGPDRDTAPFTASEVGRVVELAHARGAKVTAHATALAGTRAAVEGGVDSVEHGFEVDDDLAASMAARGTVLVSTLAVVASWRTFGATTRIERFTSAEGRERIGVRREAAFASIAAARRAGVTIATGTDFGGGSLRANQLAWEVEQLVEAGCDPWEALAAATWRGGLLLGEPDAGVLREGGPADFVLVHGDPLSDPAALWRVWRTTW
jgi:imidazolonepropionase-like amidohydrolase